MSLYINDALQLRTAQAVSSHELPNRSQVLQKLLDLPLVRSILSQYQNLLSSGFEVVYHQKEVSGAFSEFLTASKDWSQEASVTYTTVYDRIRSKKEHQPKTIQEVIDQCSSVEREGKEKLEYLLSQLDPTLSVQSPCNQMILSIFPEFGACIDQFYVLIEKGIIGKEQQRYEAPFLPGFVGLMLAWGQDWPEDIKTHWKAFLMQFFRVLVARDELGFFMTRCFGDDTNVMYTAAWDIYKESETILKKHAKSLIQACLDKKNDQVEISKFVGCLLKCISMKEQRPALADKEIILQQIMLCENFFSTSSWALMFNYYDLKNREYPTETGNSPEEDERLYNGVQYVVGNYDITSYLDELKQLCQEGDSLKKNFPDPSTDRGVQEINNEVQEMVGSLKKMEEEHLDRKVILDGKVVLHKALALSFAYNQSWKSLDKIMSKILDVEQKLLDNRHYSVAGSRYIIEMALIISNLKGLIATKTIMLSQLELYEKNQQYDWRWEVWQEEFQEQKPVDEQRVQQAVDTETELQEEEEEVVAEVHSEQEVSVDLLATRLSKLFLQEDAKQSLQAIDTALQVIIKAHKKGALPIASAKKERLFQEIQAHLFLSCQGLLQAKSAYEQCKFRKEGHRLSLYEAAIDAYIAIEKMMDLYRYREDKPKLIVHDFSIPMVRPTYSVGVEQFLQASTKGTLAVRYPHKYAEKIPMFLQPLYDNQTAIQDKLLAVAQLIKHTLEIVNTLPDGSEGISVILTEITDLINQLQEKKETPIVQQTRKLLPEELGVQDSLSALKQVVTDKFGAKRCVEQIGLHIDRLLEGQAFNRTHQQSKSTLFVRIRNLFLIGKVYEELFLFIHNTERTKPSDIHDLAQLVQEISKHIKVPEAIAQSLEIFNVGNYGHYLFTRAPGVRKDILSEAYSFSLDQIRIDEAGFEQVGSKAQEVPLKEYKELQRHHDILLKHLPSMLQEASKFYIKSRAVNRNEKKS